MNLNKCLPYFRARCKAIGLKEWTDGFNYQNIPSNILDKSYHLMHGTMTGLKQNQQDQEINFPIQVRIFTKGHREPSLAIDSAIQLTENLIIECLKPTNRLTQSSGIKNIVFENANYEPIDGSNDNAIVATINFRALVLLGF